MSDTERMLSRFFAEMWEFHQNGMGIDAQELEAALLRTGLAHVCPATAEDAERFDCDEGDEMVGITEAGRAIINAVRTTP
jgi:hypothetical protein